MRESIGTVFSFKSKLSVEIICMTFSMHLCSLDEKRNVLLIEV